MAEVFQRNFHTVRMSVKFSVVILSRHDFQLESGITVLLEMAMVLSGTIKRRHSGAHLDHFGTMAQWRWHLSGAIEFQNPILLSLQPHIVPYSDHFGLEQKFLDLHRAVRSKFPASIFAAVGITR